MYKLNLTISKNKLLFISTFLLIILNYLIIFNINFFAIREIYSLLYILTVPGLITLLILQLIKKSPLEIILISISISIAYIILGGWLLNFLLSLFSFNNPLNIFNLLFSTNIYIIILNIIMFVKKINIKIYNYPLNISKISINGSFLLLPILSILGAISLNNGSTNFFTSIMISLSALMILLLVNIKSSNINHPFLLFNITLGLLLMISMRSWYIVGSDIYGEYNVFTFTREMEKWSGDYFSGNLYNLCLSITILPTILGIISNLNSLIIYKLIFPFILALIPLGIYAICNLYYDKHISFYSSIFFISFPSFYADLTTHLRQGIGFYFFVIFLLIFFKKNIKYRNLLLILFGISTIVSHYSTSFIFLMWLTILITLILIIILINKIIKRSKKILLIDNHAPRINIFIILIFWGIFFTWYTQTGNVSNNAFIYQLNRTISNLKNMLNDDMKADRASIFKQLDINYHSQPTTILTDSYSSISKKVDHKNNILFHPITFKNYSIQYMSSAINPPTISPQFSINTIKFGEIIKRIGVFLILIGGYYLTFKELKKRKTNITYSISVFIGVILILGAMYLPFISLSYNIGRLYQQSLVILSLPATLGIFFILNKLNEKIKYLIISLFFMLHYLTFSGFLYDKIGGTQPVVQFSNAGYDYQPYYLRNQEVIAVTWLSKNKDSNRVYGEHLGYRKIQYVDKDIPLLYINLLIPQWISKNDYIYLGYTNSVENRALTWLDSISINYNIPSNFLDDNKNLIYNNKGSKIYK